MAQTLPLYFSSSYRASDRSHDLAHVLHMLRDVVSRGGQMELARVFTKPICRRAPQLTYPSLLDELKHWQKEPEAIRRLSACSGELSREAREARAASINAFQTYENSVDTWGDNDILLLLDELGIRDGPDCLGIALFSRSFLSGLRRKAAVPFFPSDRSLSWRTVFVWLAALLARRLHGLWRSLFVKLTSKLKLDRFLRDAQPRPRRRRRYRCPAGATPRQAVTPVLAARRQRGDGVGTTRWQLWRSAHTARHEGSCRSRAGFAGGADRGRAGCAGRWRRRFRRCSRAVHGGLSELGIRSSLYSSGGLGCVSLGHPRSGRAALAMASALTPRSVAHLAPVA